MATTTHTTERLANAKRQAKRLGKRLKIQLTDAKNILAKSCYRCDSWHDLERRLRAKDPEERVALLSSLPHSSAARDYFERHVPGFARSLSNLILINSDRAGLYDTLNYVFSVSQPPVSLFDIATFAHTSPWRSAGIGPDPNAVLESVVVINGVPLKLIATRVYMPKHFKYGPEVTRDPREAEPYDGNFRVIWSNLKAWYHATYTYLMKPYDNNEDWTSLDDENDDLELPTETLNSAMESHLAWFNRSLNVWDMAGNYNDEDEEFLPHIMPNLGTFLVFGFPIAVPTNASIPAPTVVEMTDDDPDLGSTIILIEGQPACLEWISTSRLRKHEGPYSELFNGLLNAVFSHSDCNLDSYGDYGHTGSYFFIRPATQFDITLFLEVEFEPDRDGEAFALQTDDPSLALTILNKVASRDLMTYSDHLCPNGYVMEVGISDVEQIDLARISLTVRGRDLWGSYNLVGARVVRNIDGENKLYALISPEFLSLTDLVPIKALRNALLSGFVQHCESGFGDRLKHSPTRCNNLRVAPENIFEVFEKQAQRDLDLLSRLNLI